MNVYKIRVKLEIDYEIPLGKSEDEEGAMEVAKGYLLEKIDHINVAYDELKAKII